ncbi:short-chain dehydrogenase [Mycolicibacterium conceptionense]|jgi:2-hydroxycyclohexanecarboxyl-CoA dehydrogenase|uniref:3-oxoacyl-[acyl-carrier-protein] reductase MabA n=2 Tax=Mycolicibacterium TaxID=1866885 RepID=A0A0J8U2B6_9MYCO|nr:MULTISPECIES: SDR family NAD(P)-dependent oxidoreductase [Mycolicibacterium]KLI06166.1 short-chain dehydrogenase [Mycolicibacterium senegalense]KLO54593.1 short-chain dehydrogenase [Mycolicibacterium senegalense]KMV15352.1 short-chain dehydrogenase [Mycolicibacterium conceptionense]OBK07804.1 short-chain dehydrogenase [Mycolicibacterium conceptionense]OMB91970.1 short-chain dehydrogenase [Mycolicibacterium conceptionense]
MSRTAVVTGGGSGLGMSIAIRLAADGKHVGVLDLNTEAAEKTATEIQAAGGRAIALGVDVSDEDAVAETFNRVRGELGPVEILVTSAAISGFSRLDKISLDQWNRYLAVNLTGTFLSIRAALSDMVAAQWGRIITISSAAGQKGAQGQAHYSAAKGGVIALTKTVALDYAAKGITANTVPPFAIETPMLREQQAAGKLPPDKYLNQMIPAGALGNPEDVAAVCSFLAADDAGYVTGQVIGVNGGAVT